MLFRSTASGTIGQYISFAPARHRRYSAWLSLLGFIGYRVQAPAAPSARFAGLRGSAARAHRPSGRRPGGGRSSLHLCHYSTTPKAPLASTLSFCRSPCRNPCKICKNAGKIKNDSYLLNFHLIKRLFSFQNE